MERFKEEFCSLSLDEISDRWTTQPSVLALTDDSEWISYDAGTRVVAKRPSTTNSTTKEELIKAQGIIDESIRGTVPEGVYLELVASMKKAYDSL